MPALCTKLDADLESMKKCIPMANTVAAAWIFRSDGSLDRQVCLPSQGRASSIQAPPLATNRLGDREIVASWENGASAPNQK
jgi:hypothetical protein